MSPYQDSIIFEMDRDGEDPLKHLLTNLLGEMSDECKPGYELDECIFAGCKSYLFVLSRLFTEIRLKIVRPYQAKIIPSLFVTSKPVLLAGRTLSGEGS